MRPDNDSDSHVLSISFGSQRDAPNCRKRLALFGRPRRLPPTGSGRLSAHWFSCFSCFSCFSRRRPSAVALVVVVVVVVGAVVAQTRNSSVAFKVTQKHNSAQELRASRVVAPARAELKRDASVWSPSSSTDFARVGPVRVGLVRASGCGHCVWMAPRSPRS